MPVGHNSRPRLRVVVSVLVLPSSDRQLVLLVMVKAIRLAVVPAQMLMVNLVHRPIMVMGHILLTVDILEVTEVMLAPDMLATPLVMVGATVSLIPDMEVMVLIMVITVIMDIQDSLVLLVDIPDMVYMGAMVVSVKDLNK